MTGPSRFSRSICGKEENSFAEAGARKGWRDQASQVHAPITRASTRRPLQEHIRKRIKELEGQAAEAGCEGPAGRRYAPAPASRARHPPGYLPANDDTSYLADGKTARVGVRFSSGAHRTSSPSGGTAPFEFATTRPESKSKFRRKPVSFSSLCDDWTTLDDLASAGLRSHRRSSPRRSASLSS